MAFWGQRRYFGPGLLQSPSKRLLAFSGDTEILVAGRRCGGGNKLSNMGGLGKYKPTLPTTSPGSNHNLNHHLAPYDALTITTGIFIMSNGSKASKDAEGNIPTSPMKDIKGNERLSLMARKFLQAEQSNYSPPRQPIHAFRKKFHFFYGTLKDAQTLAKVLNLHDLPVLVPAKIIGYRCKLWGEYPALVDGEMGEPVYGMAYEVQSPQEKERLEDYETDHYLRVGCIIEFEDGSQVTGSTFQWHGEDEELKEGDFDLKDWKMDRLEREMDSAGRRQVSGS